MLMYLVDHDVGRHDHKLAAVLLAPRTSEIGKARQALCRLRNPGVKFESGPRIIDVDIVVDRTPVAQCIERPAKFH